MLEYEIELEGHTRRYCVTGKATPGAYPTWTDPGEAPGFETAIFSVWDEGTKRYRDCTKSTSARLARVLGGEIDAALSRGEG